MGMCSPNDRRTRGHDEPVGEVSTRWATAPGARDDRALAVRASTTIRPETSMDVSGGMPWTATGMAWT